MIEFAARAASRSGRWVQGSRSGHGGSSPGPSAAGPSENWLLLLLKSMPITKQLLVAMVTLVLLTSTGVGVAVYFAVERALLPQGVVRVEADARQMATQIVAQTTNARTDLAARAKSTALRAFINAAIGQGELNRLDLDVSTWREIVSNLFAAELSAKPSYLQLRLLDAAGNEVIRVDRQSGDAPPRVLPPEELQSKEARPYVSETLALDTGEMYISPIDLNREFGEIVNPPTPVLRLATPMDGSNGERYGLLILNIDLRDTFQQLRAALATSGELFVLNAEGDFLIHPDPSKEFAFEKGERILFGAERPALAAAVAKDPGGSAMVREDGSTVAVAWARAPLAEVGPALSVVVSLPSRIARAAPAIRNSAAAVGVIAALLATIAATFTARAIVRPVVAMKDGIADASAGRPVSLPTGHGGEIGVLAQALADYIAQERFDGAVIKGSSDAILTTDHNKCITRWNPAATALFECRAEEALGRDVDKVIWPDSADSLHRTLGHRLDQNDSRIVDVSRKRRDGSTSDISLRASPVRAPDGTVLGISIIARDVTADRMAQEMFRLSVEHSPAGNILADAGGTILLVNAQVERAFGYGREELVGQPIEVLVPAAMTDKHQQFIADFLADPERRAMGEDREIFGQRKDGAVFPIEVGLTPVPSRTGTLVLAAVLDVSAERAAKRELLARTEELERSNKDLVQFAYVASHDLQEPLRMVASFTQLLSDRYKGQLDERADKYIHFAVDGARRMQGLINDLLEYSRVGASAKPLAPTEVAPLWQRVQRTLTAVIKDSGATIETGSLPTVMADGEQLSRLLQNLLSNAIKFRGDAPPHITLDRRSRWAGLALPADRQRHRLRDPRRGSNLRHVPAPARAGPLHGQRAGARHREADRRSARRPDLGRECPRPRHFLPLHASRSRHETRMTQPIKILLLEDNPADIELTSEALSHQKLRLKLDVVTDGSQALDYLHQRGAYADKPMPDLIILDLNVPRLSGKTVIADIKSTEGLKQIPIVVLTSSFADRDVIESYDLGANCYVNKPLDFASFQNIVASLETFWFTVVRLPTTEAAAE